MVIRLPSSTKLLGDLCFYQSGKLFVDFCPYAKGLTAATGMEFSHKGLYKAGERVINLERSFNVREGARRKDDTLPQRFMREPIPTGGSKAKVVPLEPMIDEYYAARKWDNKTGIPTREKLHELGLVDVAAELEKFVQEKKNIYGRRWLIDFYHDPVRRERFHRK